MKRHALTRSKNGGHCQPILFEHPSDPAIGHFELANYHALQDLTSTLNIDCEFHAQRGIRALYSRADVDAVIQQLEVLKQHDAVLAQHMRLVVDPVELSLLRVPTATGAVVTDVAARLWPYKFVSHMLEKLLTLDKLPGTFNLQTHTPVTGLEACSSEGGWSVRTARGDVVAKRVVVATNAYTSFLLDEYGDLIVPVRGQMSALLPPAQLAEANRLQDSYGFLGPAQDDYLVQRERGPRGGGSEQLLYGGGRCHGFSVGVCDDETLDPETARYLRGALNTLLGVDETSDAEELKATHEWTGIMGFSRDDKPFVGPVPGREGVFVSAGYTGHGMPNAWLCAKSCATMVMSTMHGASGEEAVDAAVEECGLPRSYLPTEERMAKARKDLTVGERDRLNGFKAEYME